MTTVLAIVGDIHAGRSTALCPPIYELTGRGHTPATVAQRWLWRCWVDYWRRVQATVVEHKAALWVVLNGDLVEGVHHNTTQVVSLRVDDMMHIAVQCIEPYVRDAQQLFVTKGTESHVGADGLWDDLIADDLGAQPDDANHSPAWHWLSLQIEQTHWAFAHHGKAGGREHMKGTGVRGMAADLTMRYARYHWRLPQHAVFGHVHKFEDSGDNYPVRVRTHGCWQLSTSYGQRIRPGLPPEIGGLCYVIHGDHVMTADPVISYIPEETPVWSSPNPDSPKPN